MKSTATTKLEAAPTTSRIGRFYIKRELARGTGGIVYLAHDPVIDRELALKTFNNRLSPVEKKQHEQQLINEARAAGRLSHPHIVTIYDACSDGNTTYIAMEYLQGSELSKMLEKGHEFNPDDVASIIWKIADALAYAHKNDVIHRDIKPANIFMIADHQPKIVDFGIARAPNRVPDQLAQAADQPYTLFRNNLLGTPNYMSPEQAMGRAVDSRTDIYSLGAVMYQMLTSRTPFQSTGTDQLLQQIAYKAPSAPHEVNIAVPQGLSEIVMKAMSKRPEKRYQDAQEMALDIKRYLSKERRARQSVKKTLRTTEKNSVPKSTSSRKKHQSTSGIGNALTAAFARWFP